MDFSSAIGRIVDTRHRRLDMATARRDAWLEVSRVLGEIVAAVADLPPALRANPDVERVLLDLVSPDLTRDVDTTIGLFRAVVNRFSRTTVNVGVSGEARVGKSTLLQSITGLTNDQIPASTGARVTATRSMITHSGSAQQATLCLHSFESFRNAVLRPYHTELDIASVPATLDQFAAFEYPQVSDFAADQRNAHRSAGLLKRLRDMQAALPSYRDLLVGTERHIDIGQVRDYITYPSEDGDKPAGDDRQYLAVRCLRIATPFPFAQVERLCVVDLPGLGEVAAESQRHHMEALRDEVDVALLVKRASQGLALWRKEDEETLDLLDEARGAVAHRRDFVVLLVNAGPDDDPLIIRTVRDEIAQGANLNQDKSPFLVLEADARNSEEVFERVLQPLLEHLTSRLPDMDEKVLVAATSSSQALAVRLSALIEGLGQALREGMRSSGSVRTDLDRRARNLRLGISSGLFRLCRHWEEIAGRVDEVDPSFAAVVDGVCDDLEIWANSGMGAVDQEQWQDALLAEMEEAKGSVGAIGEAFDVARVEVARRYAQIDDYLNQVTVIQLLDETALVLATHLGTALTGTDVQALPGSGYGRATLEHVAKTLDEAPEPCPVLTGALRDLVRLRFEFRSMVYPHIRSQLELLKQETATADTSVQLQVEVTMDGAAQAYGFISRRVRQVSHRIRSTVLSDSLQPAPVLLAAAEIFADTFIRSPESEEEFRTVAHTYRDDLWPGVYATVEAANVRASRVTFLLRNLAEHLTAATEG